jgi:hypothetical protein
MSTPLRAVLATMLALLTLHAAEMPELDFDERIRAQREIERVYESHRTGVKPAFAERVTPELLLGRVHRYLKAVRRRGATVRLSDHR